VDSIISFQNPSGNSSVSTTSLQTTSVITTKATTSVPAKVTANVTTNATAKATAVPARTNTSVPTPTPTPVTYTSAQVYLHLIDIALGTGNDKINKVTTSPEKISLDGSYTGDDWTSLDNFRQQFNNYLSTTTTISAPATGSQGNIMIKFMPGTSLNSLSQDTSYNTINGKQVLNRDENGTICSIYRTLVDSNSVETDSAYINSDLTGDKRTHYMLRGLLYYLGFQGESMKYPDSMFYSQPNTNTQLDTIDVKAVQLMYGSKITDGMTLAAIKNFY